MSAALAKIPPRTSVCLDCRTALVAGEGCDGGKKHRVTSLANESGKRRLVVEVWGPASMKRQLRNAGKAGSGGAGAGSLLQGCGDCGGCDVGAGGGEIIAILAVAAAAAIAAVLVGWLLLKLFRYVRERLDRPKPFGALSAAPVLRGRGVTGKVVGDLRSDSPLDEPSLAYALEYRCRRVLSGAVMLRDAATRGFDVALKDGRKARVPAGRIRIDGVFAARGSRTRAAAMAHLETIDPSRDREPIAEENETTNPFPFDDVVEIDLLPGDEIELVGELAPTADPEASTGSAYRDSASLLVPVGVPRIRVVAPARR